MKRILGITIVAAVVLGMSVLVMAKAHVPTHKEQVCHNEEIIAIGMPAVRHHLNHGDCFINKRNTGFQTGDPCDASNCSPVVK